MREIRVCIIFMPVQYFYREYIQTEVKHPFMTVAGIGEDVRTAKCHIHIVAWTDWQALLPLQVNMSGMQTVTFIFLPDCRWRCQDYKLSTSYSCPNCRWRCHDCTLSPSYSCPDRLASFASIIADGRAMGHTDIRKTFKNKGWTEDAGDDKDCWNSQ